MVKSIKMLDTFAGIGGFHIGTEQAASELGIRFTCVGAIEIDKECRKTYLKNLTVRKFYEDITQVDVEELPDHNFLTGGFPCQTFSRNGKFYNKNFKTLGDDDRSNLNLYLLKILAIKQPEYFLFENVKGLTEMKNKDGSKFMDTFLENLDGCGYKVYHKVLDSHRFGLAQRRQRIFFAGIRKDIRQGFQFPEGKLTDICIDDFLKKKVDSRFFLGNLWKNRKNLKPDKKGKMLTRLQSLKEAYKSGKWPKPDRPTRKISPVAIIYGDTPSGLPRQQDKLYSRFGISPTIPTFSTPCIDTNPWRQLAPYECLALQGYPKGYKLPKSDGEAYKQVGNSVSVPVIRAIVRNFFSGEKFVEQTSFI